MIITNTPRLTETQITALEIMLLGDLVLSNEGRYLLEENGVLNPDFSASKKTLKTLRQHNLTSFHDQQSGQRLLWRITPEGKEAIKEGSAWRRPAGIPGPVPRQREPLPKRPMGKTVQQGMIAVFVNHKLSKGKAFATVAEATEIVRRIQAGYATANKEVPDILLEHRRYTGISQKTLIKVLNNDPDGIHETWRTRINAYSNPKTYERFEPITE